MKRVQPPSFVIDDDEGLNDLATVDQLVEENKKILTPAMLKWQLRHRQTNGLEEAGAVIEGMGKQLLIHRRRYGRWVVTRGAGK